MIIRICVVDPSPKDPSNDVVVFQVPESSRACEILTSLLEDAGYEWVLIEPSRKPKPEEEPTP